MKTIPSLHLSSVLRRLSSEAKTPGRGRGLRANAQPESGGDRLRDLEVLGGRLPAVGDKLVFDHLTLVERAKARALDGRNMNEYVLVAGLRADEPVTLRRIEPLDGAFCIVGLLGLKSTSTRTCSRHPAPQ